MYHKILIIIVLLLTLGFYYRKCSAQPNVSINVYNVYSLNITIQVKCDYDNKTKQFQLDRIYKIPGDSSIQIIVPNHYKNCQVWPISISWFK